MKNTALFLCVFGLSLAANAQYTKAGGVAFGFGAQTLETAQLRQFLTTAPILPSTNFSVSGYAYFQVGDVVAGFSGNGISGNEIEDDNNRYLLSGGYFTVDFGYKLVNKSKWAMYPIVQAGYSGVSYTINNLETVVAGSETTQYSSATYSWGNFAYGGSLRVERYFGMKQDCEGTQGGGIIGLEMGYLTSPSSSKWTTAARTEVQGAPDYKFNSFFVRLTLGFFAGN